MPYATNGSTVVGNVTVTWNMASRYFLSAYVRNVSDERYKTGARLTNTVATQNTASLSDPRTFGAVGGVRF